MEKIKVHSIIMVISSLMLFTLNTQAQKFSMLDKNPHDVIYYRLNKMVDPQIKVVYGRPSAEDKKVFGTQVPYHKIWKTGSNESTEIKFYQDVMFGNKYVKAGTYTLYTIPSENYWTIILNSTTDTYGAHFYNPKNDLVKIEVPVSKGEMMDNFTIAFKSKTYGSQMVLAWAKTRVNIPLYTEKSLITRI